jgi:molybdopterin-guanine dinucleotide biosynthesis protein A
MTGLPVVILAGGRATRLGGGDKCLLQVGGATVLSRILARLRPVRAAINANGDPARFAAYGLPVLSDSMPGWPGPLAGILAAMEWAGSGDVVTVPGDAPFLPPDLVSRLVAARDAAGAVIAVAVSGGRQHPVAALWPAGLAGELRGAITVEELRRVGDWLARFAVAEAMFDDHPIDPFFNMNEAADVAEAERLCRLHWIG